MNDVKGMQTTPEMTARERDALGILLSAARRHLHGDMAADHAVLEDAIDAMEGFLQRTTLLAESVASGSGDVAFTQQFFALRISQRREIADRLGLISGNEHPQISDFERSKRWIRRAHIRNLLPELQHAIRTAVDAV